MENKSNVENNIFSSKNNEDVKIKVEKSLQDSEQFSNIQINNIEIYFSIFCILFILLMNCIIFNKFNDNLIIPFITFVLSLYLVFKYFPKKMKEKYNKDFESLFKILNNGVFFDNKKTNVEKNEYIIFDKEDENKMLLNEEKKDNNINNNHSLASSFPILIY